MDGRLPPSLCLAGRPLDPVSFGRNMMIHKVADILRIEFAKDRVHHLHATAEELGGFVPQPARCHDNARRWVEEHPSYGVIRGWLAENEDFLFVKHSVVQKSCGSPHPLICVTLGAQSKWAPTRFVMHQYRWTKEPFASLPPQVLIPDA